MSSIRSPHCRGGRRRRTAGHAVCAAIAADGWAPVSNPPVSLGNNYLAAVTSYGPIATEPAYLGASQFDSNFTNLLNSACSAATGNC